MTITTSPMLALVPGTRTAPGTGANTERPVFFLGTHHPGWLKTAAMPLFISDRRLRTYRNLPRAQSMWALDSGGFTELSRHGKWDHGPSARQYAARIRRYRDEIGHLAWAAPQDWMCEPAIIAKTGLTITEHQRRTIDSVLCLRDLNPDLPVIPVLQGWTVTDYLRCADSYQRAGIDLSAEPLVGLGSVCRRQATTQTELILTALHAHGINRLHGFGVKIQGLIRCGHLLVSADSMAWSFAARHQPPLPGCEIRHINCANCPRYAANWYWHVCASLNRNIFTQLPLFDFHGGAALCPVPQPRTTGTNSLMKKHSPRCTPPDMTPGSITSGMPPPAPAQSGYAATSATSTPPLANSCAPSPPWECRTA